MVSCYHFLGAMHLPFTMSGLTILANESKYQTIELEVHTAISYYKQCY